MRQSLDITQQEVDTAMTILAQKYNQTKEQNSDKQIGKNYMSPQPTRAISHILNTGDSILTIESEFSSGIDRNDNY